MTKKDISLKKLFKFTPSAYRHTEKSVQALILEERGGII